MAPASLPPCSLFCRCCCWSFRRHRWCSLHRRRHRCSFFAGEKEDNLLMKIKKRTNRKNLATAATSTTLSSPISPPPLSLSRYSFCKSTLFPVNQSGPLCKYTLFPVNHSIDGSIPAIKLATYRRRLGSDNKVNRDKVNACKVPLARNMGSEFSCMIKEAKILGKDGCFTADSDIFLFGAKTVYRDIDLADGGHVVSYELADVEEKLGFRRNSLGMVQVLGAVWTGAPVHPSTSAQSSGSQMAQLYTLLVVVFWASSMVLLVVYVQNVESQTCWFLHWKKKMKNNP